MYRYRLERKEPVAMPCIIGNHSFPLPTYRWKTIAISNDRKELEKEMRRFAQPKNYRIEEIPMLVPPKEDAE